MFNNKIQDINLDFNYYYSFLNNFFQIADGAESDNIKHLNDSLAIFHTSTPNIKMYYPEPFVATPTFVHDDI